MSVTFAVDLVEIKEYNEEYSIVQDKKKAYKKAKRCCNKTSRVIRNILYKYLPSEEEYVSRREKGSSSGGIRFIEGYLETLEEDYEILYKDEDKKIKYNIYENNYSKMVATVEIKGFSGKKHFKTFIDCGYIIEDLFKAEYKAKKFVIETVRKIFKENDIM